MYTDEGAFEGLPEMKRRHCRRRFISQPHGRVLKNKHQAVRQADIRSRQEA